MSSSQPKQEQSETITVGELVYTPHLRLSVLAGEPGLDRRVTWTHVSELENPGQWLDGGELLISSGLGVPESPEEQVAYVEGLANAHAAGLALGDRGPERHKDMLAAADRLNFPILRIPYQIPFLAIARLVAASNQSNAQRRLVTRLRIFDALRPHDGKRPPVADLFAELERIAGFRLALLSPSGRPLFPEMPAEAAELPDELPTPPATYRRLPYGYVLEVPVGGRLAAYLVATEDAASQPAGLSAAQHIATIAALEITDAYRVRDARRRSGAEVLTELLMHSTPPAVRQRRLADEGMPAKTDLALSIWRGYERVLDDEELHHRLCDDAVPHLMLRQQSEVFVVMPFEADAYLDLAEVLGATVGISKPVADPFDFAVASHEARWALQRPAALREGAVSRFDEVDSSVYWMPTDQEALRQLVDRILGPIETYDEENSTELLHSLVTYLQHHRKLAIAAKELHIHKHTLSYRLKRIQELTDRDLNDLQDLSDFWLATKALPIVRSAPTSAKG